VATTATAVTNTSGIATAPALMATSTAGSYTLTANGAGELQLDEYRAEHGRVSQGNNQHDGGEPDGGRQRRRLDPLGEHQSNSEARVTTLISSYRDRNGLDIGLYDTEGREARQTERQAITGRQAGLRGRWTFTAGADRRSGSPTNTAG
jgi:hypothetical protein